MNGSDGSGLTSFFDSAGPQAAVTQEYRTVATGNVSSTVDALDVAQEHLSAQEAQLQASEEPGADRRWATPPPPVRQPR